jgi:hypothetical protein
MANEKDTKGGDRIAQHDLLDATGGVVDNEESARGYRYTMVATGDTFDWQWDEANEDERRMVALFGAKTLATNESSQVRNNKKREGASEDWGGMMAAIQARFKDIRGGIWIDRTREGVAAVDKPALREAICQVLVANGRKTQAEIDSGFGAEVLQKLEEDAEYLRKARTNPDVQSAYAKIKGRAQATVDDLASL